MTITPEQPEVWEPIPGWEGFYSVSSHSRIRSEPRNVYRVTTRRSYTVHGRVLRPNRRGGVNLSRPGKRLSVTVQRVTACIFGPDRETAA